MRLILIVAVAVVFLVGGFNAQKVEDDLNLNSDEKNQLVKIENECIEETKASKEEVHKFDTGVFADNKPLRRFYRCLLTQFGVMDAAGRIVMSKINLLVPDAQRTKAEHCFNVEKGEPEDVAYECYKCYIQSVYFPK